ncbi:MAG: 3-hydroxybutyryl-CoA dehydrogenase [Candidatus Marinimicrobia bacterium]|nr:3-hydroxybutyryl-CoA dehydrogenase [Candidatus Neomarinimicrobiota bacterium]
MKDELADLIKSKPESGKGELGLPIAIMGAGSVGTQLAQTVASNGHNTNLVEINPDLVESVQRELEANMDAEIKRWGMTEGEKRAILARIAVVTNLEAAAQSQFVLEAIPESLEAKQQLYLDLHEICPPETIFVTNTSILSLTEISSKLPRERQKNMIGLHFLRPVPDIPLVEIVRAVRTSDDTFEKVKEFAESLGKTPVEVFEYPGYITTRIILPFLNEAMCVLMEGVASAEDIDTAMKLGFNLPHGPLAMADQYGLDQVLTRLDVMFHELGDLKYRPCPTLKKMVRAGRLGVKTGRGFFDYRNNSEVEQ